MYILDTKMTLLVQNVGLKVQSFLSKIHFY